jgi:hypothetical protein
MRRVAGLLVVLSTSAGCRDVPARITVGNGDTVVINSPRAVTLPVRIVDRKGDVIRRKEQVRFEVTAGSALRALGGDSIACSGAGDAHLRMSSGPISSSVVVLCRPIHSVRTDMFVELTAGGASHPLTIGGFDERREPVREIAFGVTVADSSIAFVRDGRVHPRGPGWTFLLIDMAGCQVAVHVRVHDTISSRDTASQPVIRDLIPRKRMCAQRMW